MLTPTLMGYVALWIVWGNTLLVALAAAKQAIALLAKARSFEPVELRDGAVGMLKGRVSSAAAIAEHTVEQNGRLATGKVQSIVWHDRSFAGCALDGEILLASGERVGVEAGPAEVWFTPSEMDAAQRCKDTPTFEDAYAHARRVKGFARTVVASIEPERDVYVVGQVVHEGDSWLVRPVDGKLLMATEDPRAWARARAYLVLLGFIPAIALGALACTLLALTEPVFEGLTSKLGGLAGLVFFLLVLPAGTAVRDMIRMPHQRFLRGRWIHPEGKLGSDAVAAQQRRGDTGAVSS